MDLTVATWQWLQCSIICILLWMRGSVGLHYKVKSDEERLLDKLFKDYNPSARPVLNSSHTVNVDLSFSLLQIQDLNVRSQVFTTTGLLILRWVDERLRWTYDDVPLEQLVIDARYLWKPEFAVINGAEAIYQDYSEFQAVLHPNGLIKWEPGGVFKTMCHIDITYYPFDKQTCVLQFGAWSYYTSKMNLTTDTSKINLESYEKNGEWEILSTQVQRNEFTFKCCPDQPFSNIEFKVHLRRRHTFYIMNVILPGVMTSLVLLSIFFCTPAQKVHIGVASLLSFRLFLLNVADTIPRTSDHVPLLGIYLTCTMAITTMAMVATVFVLNLYGMKEKPLPKWAKTVFITYMAKFLCMCNCASPQNYVVSDAESNMPSAANRARSRSRAESRGFLSRRKSSVAEDTNLLPVRGRGSISGSAIRSKSSDSGVYQRRATLAPDGAYRDLSPGRFQMLYGDPRRYGFGPFTDRDKDKDKKVDFSKDWVHVAAVFDRLFFWLCLIFIVMTTLVLFHPITTSKLFKIPLLDGQKDGG